MVLRDGDAGHDENSVGQLCQPKKDKDKDEYMIYMIYMRYMRYMILMNGDGGTWREFSEITLTAQNFTQ